MDLDETCCFLAIDFDKEGWEKDISIIRETCFQFEIPVAIERSQSGNGCHAWFFFKDKIPAVLARKFGTSLLTHSMSKRHKISFDSYDRLFPNQDTMPKGGFGNLIALPLQKIPRDIRSHDTKPEKILRSALQRNGFRYKKNVKSLPGKPDIVLPKYNTEVFVNGCFWHQHENCKRATLPKSNQDYWVQKLNRNTLRDKENSKALKKLGWDIITVWECEINKNIDSVINSFKMLRT